MVSFADSVSPFDLPAHFGAGYYNPVPPPSEEDANAASSNNYSSFIGADIPFSLQVRFLPVSRPNRSNKATRFPES